MGSTAYAYEGALDGFGNPSNKCNLFVSHAVEQGAGVDFPRRTRFGFSRGPVAAGTLASNADLPHTRLVNPEDAIIGDIVSWARPDFANATGHTAIFTGSLNMRINGVLEPRGQGDQGTIGAGEFTVNYRTFEYLTSEGYLNPVYRRVVP